jgi:putative nucleotidyltransferase with HDIG domain
MIDTTSHSAPLPRHRILFVDDEPAVLEVLRKILGPMRHEWVTEFALNGEAALELMAGGRFDVLVTDLRMPGMDGAALLEQVMTRYPETIRMVLSGVADQVMAARTFRSAHCYLTKPCRPDVLKTAIESRLSLRRSVTDDRLQAIVAHVTSLPSLPPLYGELMSELEAPEPSLRRVGAIVEEDVGLTAKILQLVNSSVFGLAAPMSSAADAVRYLGVDTVRTLVLGLHAFSQFPLTHSCFDASALWRHSSEASRFARAIAMLEGVDVQIRNEAMAAGLLHDCGKLVLATVMPHEYREATAAAHRENAALWEVEIRTFGCSHAEVGAYLLGLWGLPQRVVEIVAMHHRPLEGSSGAPCPLAAVHAANAIDHELSAPEAPSRVDRAFLEMLDLQDTYSRWKTACAELPRQSAATRRRTRATL